MNFVQCKVSMMHKFVDFFLYQYKLWSYYLLCWTFNYVALLNNEIHKNWCSTKNVWSNHCMQIKLFYRTYLSSRMSNFCTTSGNGASFRRVFSTSSQVSVEFSTSRLPNNSNTFPPNVLSQACSSLPEQAAFTDSTE